MGEVLGRTDCGPMQALWHGAQGRTSCSHELQTVIADRKAFRGYVVTTSGFSSKAVAYAAAAPTMVLVDMAGLVRWHRDGAGL